MVSTYPDRAKAPTLAATSGSTVLSDAWDGPYVQVDGRPRCWTMPEALDPLVDYFRSISGEHPDWDEYRQAMRGRRSPSSACTIEPWGPIATGGFPPELADDGWALVHWCCWRPARSSLTVRNAPAPPT